MHVTTVHRCPFPVPAGMPINPPGAATPPGDACSQLRGEPEPDDSSLETSCRSSARTQEVVFGQVAAPVENRMDHGASDRDALYQRIHAYIEQNLGDETLGVASLRSMFRLSRATLYVLFENEGGVVRHIRKCRLQAACHYLQQHPVRTRFYQRATVPACLPCLFRSVAGTLAPTVACADRHMRGHSTVADVRAGQSVGLPLHVCHRIGKWLESHVARGLIREASPFIRVPPQALVTLPAKNFESVQGWP
jgi:AraC-like DNA-binding protein